MKVLIEVEADNINSGMLLRALERTFGTLQFRTVESAADTIDTIDSLRDQLAYERSEFTKMLNEANARVEVAEAGYSAAVRKAQWQASTNAELNELEQQLRDAEHQNNLLKIANRKNYDDACLAEHADDDTIIVKVGVMKEFKKRLRDAEARVVPDGWDIRTDGPDTFVCSPDGSGLWIDSDEKRAAKQNGPLTMRLLEELARALLTPPPSQPPAQPVAQVLDTARPHQTNVTADGVTAEMAAEAFKSSAPQSPAQENK